MKTASKIIFPVVGLFYLLQCSSNQISYEKGIPKNDINNHIVIDYTRTSDTTYYIFDIIPNEADGDTFRVTKTIWVEDSCFGIYNDTNWQLASDYQYDNNIPIDVTVNFHIDYLEKGRAKNLWNITNAHYSREISLEEGYSEIYTKRKYYSNYFMRIILKTNYNTLSRVSLNYRLDENGDWIYLSKERIHTEKFHNQDTRNIGYCLDTLSKIEGKDIDWYQITDTYAWQVCEGE